MRGLRFVALASLILLGAGCGGGHHVALRLPGLNAACGVGKPRVRPRQVNFCGDGSFVLTRMKWPTWTAAGAVGNGTANINDCTPDCAEGHFHAFAVSVRIARPVACRHRTRAFTRLAVFRLAGRKAASGTYNYAFGCLSLRGHS
jgi:hypothetical protein